MGRSFQPLTSHSRSGILKNIFLEPQNVLHFSTAVTFLGVDLNSLPFVSFLESLFLLLRGFFFFFCLFLLRCIDI